MLLKNFCVCSVLFFILSLGNAQIPEQMPYYQNKLIEFSMAPIVPDDIVMVGDSHTDAADWALIFKNWHVKNRGISGDTSQALYHRLDSILMGQPQKIFIMIGINDIVGLNLRADQVVANVKRILWKIQKYSPKTKIYLQSVLPVNSGFAVVSVMVFKHGLIKDLNQQLEKLATQRGVKFINLYPYLVEPRSDNLRLEYTSDGLHLNQLGYSVWAREIRRYINE